jgi:stage V sporulation protein G
MAGAEFAALTGERKANGTYRNGELTVKHIRLNCDMALKISDVKIALVTKKDPVKAFVAFLVNDCLLTRDAKVIEVKGECFVAMPSKKLNNGVYQDTVALINKETRKLIEDAVLNEYERVSGERMVRRNSGD